jgi:hypothetical protein
MALHGEIPSRNITGDFITLLKRKVPCKFLGHFSKKRHVEIKINFGSTKFGLNNVISSGQT